MNFLLKAYVLVVSLFSVVVFAAVVHNYWLICPMSFFSALIACEAAYRIK